MNPWNDNQHTEENCDLDPEWLVFREHKDAYARVKYCGECQRKIINAKWLLEHVIENLQTPPRLTVVKDDSIFGKKFR